MLYSSCPGATMHLMLNRDVAHGTSSKNPPSLSELLAGDRLKIQSNPDNVLAG